MDTETPGKRLALAGLLAILGLTSVLSGQANAQDDATSDEQKQLIERRAEKLAEPFLKKAAWHTDFEKAQAAARDQRKLIFAYFTRSYSP